MVDKIESITVGKAPTIVMRHLVTWCPQPGERGEGKHWGLACLLLLFEVFMCIQPGIQCGTAQPPQSTLSRNALTDVPKGVCVL